MWPHPGFESWTRCHTCKWVEFVVGSRPCPEGFSPGSPVFLPPQKSTFLNSNSIGNSRATGLSVMCYPRKIKLINYYYSLVFKMSLGQQKSVFLFLKPYKTGLKLLRKKIAQFTLFIA